jgi:hypothetical protein
MHELPKFQGSEPNRAAAASRTPIPDTGPRCTGVVLTKVLPVAVTQRIASERSKTVNKSLVTDAKVLLSKTFHASWSIGLAAALVAAIPPDMARAENIVGGAFCPPLARRSGKEGAFRHLRALQDIASESGGNRAAGTLGYDRSAEYVAERLKEAGYLVHFEEFEFPASMPSAVASAST